MCFLRYKHFTRCGHEVFLELLVCTHHSAEDRTCCDISRPEVKMTTTVHNACLPCIEKAMRQKVSYTHWRKEYMDSGGYLFY